MIRYRCEHDNMEVNTSVCPHCGQRAFPFQSEIYWCSNCNVPTYDNECALCHNEGKYLSVDVRPVFPEEKLLLETILKQEGENSQEISLKEKSVWRGAGKSYYVNGEKLDIKIGKLKELDIEKICLQYEEKIEGKLEEYKRQFDIEQEMFVKANERRLWQIE